MDQKTFQTAVVGLLGLGVVVLVAMFAMDYSDRPTEMEILNDRLDKQVQSSREFLDRLNR